MSKDSKPVKEQTKPGSNNSKNPPWNPVLGVIFACAVFIIAQFMAAFAVYGTSLIIKPDNETFLHWFDNSILAKTLLFVFMMLFVLLTLRWFTSLYKTNFASIGLSRKPKFSDLGWAVLAFPAYFLLLIVSLAIIKLLVPGLDLEQKQDLGFNATYHGFQLVGIFFALVIVPPITEEIVFRGFIFGSLKKAMPIIAAAILTSLLFGAGHLLESSGSQPLYVAGIDTFVLSMILIWLRQKTGSLWASISLHALKNGTAFVTLFLLAGR